MIRLFLCAAAAAGLLAPATAAAQNTAGIFPGNIVTEGRQLLQYRFVATPGENGADGLFGHRLHYDHAFNERQMGRLLVQANDRGDGLEYTFVKVEFFQELTAENAKVFSSTIRGDWTLNDGAAADQVAVFWGGQWQHSPVLQSRVIVGLGKQYGDRAVDGVLPQTRARVHWKPDGNITYAVEMYSVYGSTEDLGSFKDQRHQLGPVLTFALGQGLSTNLGAMFGLSDATPEEEFRFWLTKKF